MPDTCPVCGTTNLHCYMGKPIDPLEWHRLADRERIRLADDMVRNAESLESFFGKTGRTIDMRARAYRLLRGEENYP